MMDLKSVLAAISEWACYDAVAPHWEDSMATLPASGPSFLDAEAIREYRELAGIEASVDGDLEVCAEGIRGSAELRALIWHCYHWTYTYPDVGRMQGWPTFEAALGERGDVFYLIVVLAMVPLIREANAALQVPREITRQTFSSAASFLDRYRKGHGGRNGVVKVEMWWLRNYTNGSILRIGRFEYRPYLFRGPVRVYRNRRSGETLALAEEGTRFDRLGYVESVDAPRDSKGWTSHRIVDHAAFRGTPISPEGRALRRDARLDRAEWQELIVPNETLMLDIHIPNGGAMTLEAVRTSLEQAAEYFQAREDSKNVAGFYCISWVFSPHLEEIFSPLSNLVRLIQEVYLFPVPTDRADGLFFIFSDERFYGGRFDPETFAELRPRTSLETKIHDFIRTRQIWRGGGMFLLMEDLPRLGSQPYRRK